MSRKMDTTTIEEIGVNELERSILYSETLSPIFKRRDKYPVWDGEIMLYNEGHKNDNNYLTQL